jgi:hypothetical protein
MNTASPRRLDQGNLDAKTFKQIQGSFDDLFILLNKQQNSIAQNQSTISNSTIQPIQPVPLIGAQPLNANLTAISALTFAANNLMLLNGTAALSVGQLTDAYVSPSAAIAWTKISKTGSNLTDLVTRDHTALTSIGTNTHAQIDTALTRLANTSGTNTGDQPVIQGISVTIASATNATTEIGYIDLTTNSSFSCSLSIDALATGYEHSSQYIVSGYRNCTAGAWQLVNPVKVSDQNSTPTYGLEMKVDNTTAYFRARELRTLV